MNPIHTFPSLTPGSSLPSSSSTTVTPSPTRKGPSSSLLPPPGFPSPSSSTTPNPTVSVNYSNSNNNGLPYLSSSTLPYGTASVPSTVTDPSVPSLLSTTHSFLPPAPSSSSTSILHENILDNLPDLNQLLRELESNSLLPSSFSLATGTNGSLGNPLPSPSFGSGYPSSAASSFPTSSFTHTNNNISMNSTVNPLLDFSNLLPNPSLFVPSPNPSLPFTSLSSPSSTSASMVPFGFVLPVLQKLHSSQLLIEMMQKTINQAQEYIQTVETNHKNALEQQRLAYEENLRTQSTVYENEKREWTKTLENSQERYATIRTQLAKEQEERRIEIDTAEQRIRAMRTKEEEYLNQIKHLNEQYKQLQITMQQKSNESQKVLLNQLKTLQSEYNKLQQEYNEQKDKLEGRIQDTEALCTGIKESLKSTNSFVLDTVVQYDNEYSSSSSNTTTKTNKQGKRTTNNKGTKNDPKNDTATLLDQLDERTRLLGMTILLLQNNLYPKGIESLDHLYTNGTNDERNRSFSRRTDGTRTETDESEIDHDADDDDEDTKEMISAVEKAFHQQIGSTSKPSLPSLVVSQTVEEGTNESTEASSSTLKLSSQKKKKNSKKRSTTSSTGTNMTQKSPFFQFLRKDEEEQKDKEESVPSVRKTINPSGNFTKTSSTDAAATMYMERVRAKLEERAKAYGPKFHGRASIPTTAMNETNTFSTDDSEDTG